MLSHSVHTSGAAVSFKNPRHWHKSSSWPTFQIFDFHLMTNSQVCLALKKRTHNTNMIPHAGCGQLYIAGLQSAKRRRSYSQASVAQASIKVNVAQAGL
jgi:hypothetical protein